MDHTAANANDKSRGQEKIQETRKQVDEVTDVMKNNMDRILEREGKLGDLQLRADQLQTDTEQFQRTGIKLKRQYYWENMKMKLLIALCVLIVIIIIVCVIVANIDW